jgi:predicted extracellular nuclease
VLSALVINEVDYDQPGTDGAEFVELKNVGSTSLDLSAYTLELVNGNGATAYQSFPLPALQLAPGDYFVLCGDAANTPDCDLDVSPDTNLIQNGAPDAVVLVSGGEVVDALSYEGSVPGAVEGTGFGGGDDNSTPYLGLSRLPDGFDSDDNSVDFSLRCISPGAANLATTTDCDAPGTQVLEIWEIQGSGLASPVAGTTVQTLANVVTAVGPEGFFIQTPDARVDADPETSNGIYVFTGAAPAVAVGDLVDVTGMVVEFFDFTEFTSPVTVDVVGAGILPLPVLFDENTPSPNQPQPATELERYEGMLVAIVDGTVTGPNQFFGSDNVAEVFITAASSRTFREKGIEYPGLAGLPVWDGNPEVFELDPDRLGLPNQTIAAGSSFDATGVLGFEFGGYELWPSALAVREAILPRPVRAEVPGEYTIGSLNLFRLFDDVDDPGSNEQVVSTAEYQVRLEKFSRYIREVLGSPDILGVQEVESEKTLQDLGDRIALDDPTVQYTAYLVEGNDVGGIDVGYLVRRTVTVDDVTQLAAGEINTFDGSLLHDRPPLLLEGSVETLGGVSNPVSVLNLHLRSLGGIDDPADGDRVRSKRLQQAQSVAGIVQDLQTMDPAIRLVVLGDFNAYEFTDGYVDVTGQIKGDFDPSENLLSGPDLVDPNLTDQVLSLPQEERYSFIFRGSAQVLDHALTSSALAGLVRGFDYGRANADAALVLLDDPSTALRSSDHDGLVLFVAGDADGDGVGDDLDNCPTTPNPDQADADGDGLADACLDACPGTVVPEISAGALRPNHFALVDGDFVFDQGQPWNGAPVSSGITLEDTAGCSCSQILDVLPGNRNGQRKFGCTAGTMEQWLEMVN